MERGLLLRIRGPANKLQKQQQMVAECLPNRKLHGEISTNKGPDLIAGRGETGLVFMCQRKPGHTVKKVREIRCAQKLMFVVPILSTSVFNVRLMSLLERD